MMFQWLRRWLAPPIFEDEAKTRSAGLLYTILLLLFTFTVLTVPYMAMTASSRDIAIADLVIGILVGLMTWGGIVLTRRGYVQAAGVLLSLFLLALITGMLVYFRGIRDPSSTMYFVVIAVAALLLGARTALLFGLLSILCALGVYYAEVRGWVVYPMALSVDWFDWFLLSISLAMGALLLWYAVRSIEQGFASATRHARELERVNRELIASQNMLQAQARDLARRARYLEATAIVTKEATSALNVEMLLSRVAALISECFGFYHTGIFLIDEAGEYAILRAASSEGGQRMLAQGYRLAVGREGVIPDVVRTGQPRIALNVGENATVGDNPDLPLTRSELALPLRVGERVIGVLDVHSAEPEAFSKEDVAVLQTLADQVALAIQNARLLEETQDRLREVAALTREYAVREWERLVSTRPGWGYVYDGVEAMPSEVAPVDRSGAALTLPLQIPGGEPIGRLLVALPDRPPDPEEIALARTVVEQATQALESARLFQETRRTLSEMEVLYRASQAISTAGNPDEVLHAFVDHIVPTQIDRCILALLDPASPEEPTIELIAAWDRGKEKSPVLGRRWSVAQIPFLGRLTTEPVVVSDVANAVDVDETSRHIALNVLGIRAFLAIPLVTRQRLLGWLLVESLTGPYEFTEREIRLYRTLADQAAVALERMRLFEETRRRAEWERIRAEVSARVRASTDMETILRTAVRELGRAFRAAEGVIQLHRGDGYGS
ncbi:MAG: GAF domain-containing protein [Anaerolineae bacterium]|nr:GAF domain-containing protein [Anaerolineae bacterium]MDW8068615.1 GAF domain-containing protein [Anaerolineae bacterium]